MPTSVTLAAPGHAEACDLARTVRDAVRGEEAVKKAGQRYLPVPNAADMCSADKATADAAKARYAQYVLRAVYLNVTGRTHDALVGLVMRQKPLTDVPAALEYLKENCDGAGSSLEQLSKKILGELLEAGVYGLLTDYPRAEPGLSAEEVQQRNLSARIAGYPLESVINFRAELRANAYVLTLVVLREARRIPLDEFTYEERWQYRVLSLDENGNYLVRLFEEDGELMEQFNPTDGSGNYWREIPFAWIGADENFPRFQKPPLIDLANVNLAHYRNSADREESLFMMGQPTLFLTSDMSADQFRTANPNGVVVGSRMGHFLGPNGDAKLVQFESGSALQEAMVEKVGDMVLIGARLITSRTGTQTAEAARIDASAESSVLSTLTGNASEGIEKALEFAAQFMNADPAAVNFELNQKFFDTVLDPQTIMAAIQLADRGDIAQSDIRNMLRTGVLLQPSRTDEQIDDEVAAGGGGLGSGQPTQ